MKELDVLVSATITPEAFGRVIIEAQACGVPVVATKVGGVVDIIEDNRSGLLCTAGNPDDSGGVNYNKTTPVAGIVFNAAPAWNVYANLGRGFETPTLIELAYRPGGATGLNFALQPATSLHKEIGVKGKLGNAARVNLALFHIDTSDEIVVNSAAGGRTDYKNASKTRREGVEFALESYLGAGFEAYLAYTWIDAQFTQPFTSGTPVADWNSPSLSLLTPDQPRP